ncbi:hypothetical protein C8D77_101278 [Mesorhizobium loti]|uniref:Lipoprotein n=1 Tax=Rhizobium loti TaxID=381 RepID=A0A8E2WFQ2_RHILI|nr:hypothetical protein [Mesorhizobium loti]PWJ93599.1 hypothetical protein C8D77_101278 [Mesorhizobium loti]
MKPQIIAAAITMIALAACATAPDMSRREASNITNLAIVMGPHP